MKILISPRSVEEAKQSVAGGADIIDVKRPEEGSLGANFPLVIKDIRKAVPEELEVSATVGDCPNLPGTVSQAALGASLAGADYVKIGLYGTRTAKDAEFLLKKVVENVNAFFPKVKVIAAGYADYEIIESVPLLELPKAAANAGCVGVLIDTAKKDKGLLEKQPIENLEKFVELCKKHNILSALAGSLTKEDAVRVKKIGVDIIGIRGAVCEGKDRVAGTITEEKVRNFVEYANK